MEPATGEAVFLFSEVSLPRFAPLGLVPASLFFIALGGPLIILQHLTLWARTRCAKSLRHFVLQYWRVNNRLRLRWLLERPR